MIAAFVILETAALAQKQCDILSKKTVGGDQSEGLLQYVTRLRNGSFIIGISSSSSYGNFNLSCINSSSAFETDFQQYDPTGSYVQWERCFSASTSTFARYGIVPTSKNEFYSFGSDSSAACPGGLALKREKADGTLIWKKVYGGTNSSSYVLYRAALRTADSGFVLVGASYATDGDVGSHYGQYMTQDIWVLKLDSSGNKVWSRNIGGTFDDDPTSIAEAPGGGVYVGAVVRSTDFDCTGTHGTTAAGTADAYVIRLDRVGQIMWHRCLGGSKGDGTYGLCADASGGVVVAAATFSSDGDVPVSTDSTERYWILNIDSTGSITWNKTFGSPAGYEEPSSICRAYDGTYWIAGVSNSKGGEVDTAFGKGDSWVLHLNGNGDFINARVLGSLYGSNGTSFITPITSANGVMVGGLFLGPGGTMPADFFAQPGSPNCFLTRLAPASVSVEPVTLQNQVLNIWFDQPNDLRVGLNESNQVVQYSIFNVFGQRIIEGTFALADARGVIRLPESANGTYYLRVISKTSIRTVKFSRAI